MLRSVRHVANQELRKARRTARRAGAVRPPWRGSLRELVSSMASSLSLVRLLVLLIAWVAALGGVSLAQPASTGVSAATTSTLEVLWQVQATSVGLVLVLVVFVFGLLPQGRRRLTYRQFL